MDPFETIYKLFTYYKHRPGDFAEWGPPQRKRLHWKAECIHCGIMLNYSIGSDYVNPSNIIISIGKETVCMITEGWGSEPVRLSKQIELDRFLCKRFLILK
jgi:hypothetical protein